MNNYITLLIKRNVMLFLTLISFLFCLGSVISMSHALSIANDPLILAIDSNGTRVVRRSDDPIFETEAIQFLKFYLKNLYTFSSLDFLKNVGVATGYMSLDLWEKERSKILGQYEIITKDQITSVATIKKIFKEDDTEFVAIISISEKSRLSQEKRLLKLRLQLNKVPRSNFNPYGIEVRGYENEEIK